MSQVDFIIFIPLLFWFIIFFIIFYILMYIYIIPLLFSALKVKQLFFFSLIENLCISNIFFEVYFFLDNNKFKFIINKLLKCIFLIKIFGNFNYIIKLLK